MQSRQDAGADASLDAPQWEVYASRSPVVLMHAPNLVVEAFREACRSRKSLRIITLPKDREEFPKILVRLKDLDPLVVLLDVEALGDDAYNVAHFFVERHCHVILMNAPEDVENLERSIVAGISGYLLRHASLEETAKAAHAVIEGEVIVPPDLLSPLLKSLVEREQKRRVANRVTSKLTRREKQVLLHIARGSDYSEIAKALLISVETTRTHVHNIFSKLGVHSRLEAVSLVLRYDLKSELTE